MNSVSCEVTRQGPSTLNVTFSLRGEIILPSLHFSSLMVTLTTVFNELACTVLTLLLEGIDTLLLANKEAGVEYRNRKPRTLKTIFGEVRFRCRQAKKHGIHFSPLIEALGIPRKKRITQDLLALSLIAALYASYRNAMKTGGMPCALSTLWNAVQKEGRAYIHKRDAACAYYQQGEPLIPASPRDFAMVMMDEIHIRHTKKKNHLKVKVARLSVVRCTVDDEGKETYHFEPIRVYARVHMNADRYVKEVRTFFDAVAGLAQIPRIIVMTDGCSMGKKLCALYPEQSVWQLDWWHLWKYVHEGCKFEPNLKWRIWDLLNVQRIDEALGLLSLYRDTMKSLEEKMKNLEPQLQTTAPVSVGPKVFWKTRQRELLEDLITYIHNNREAIYGLKAYQNDIPAEHLSFGTGPIERLQAVMVAYRMKKRGMHWSVDGAENLIQLLAKERNGEDVDQVIDEGLRGLKEWEELCDRGSLDESPSHYFKKNKGNRSDFSPSPALCIPILHYGKQGPMFTALKEISARKLIPPIAEKRKEVILHLS